MLRLVIEYAGLLIFDNTTVSRLINADALVNLRARADLANAH